MKKNKVYLYIIIFIYCFGNVKTYNEEPYTMLQQCSINSLVNNLEIIFNTENIKCSGTSFTYLCKIKVMPLNEVICKKHEGLLKAIIIEHGKKITNLEYTQESQKDISIIRTKELNNWKCVSNSLFYWDITLICPHEISICYDDYTACYIEYNPVSSFILMLLGILFLSLPFCCCVVCILLLYGTHCFFAIDSKNIAYLESKNMLGIQIKNNKKT